MSSFPQEPLLQTSSFEQSNFLLQPPPELEHFGSSKQVLPLHKRFSQQSSEVMEPSPTYGLVIAVTSLLIRLSQQSAEVLQLSAISEYEGSSQYHIHVEYFAVVKRCTTFTSLKSTFSSLVIFTPFRITVTTIETIVTLGEFCSYFPIGVFFRSHLLFYFRGITKDKKVDGYEQQQK